MMCVTRVARHIFVNLSAERRNHRCIPPIACYRLTKQVPKLSVAGQQKHVSCHSIEASLASRDIPFGSRASAAAVCCDGRC